MEDNNDHMLLNLTTNSSREERKVLVKTRDHASLKAKKYSARRAKLKSSTHNVDERKVPRNEYGEKFQVVSSLFHKNPDIPQISNDVLQSDMQCSKKDETFSGSEFKHLNLAPFMISNLELNLHMTTMTSVQKASLPLLINGKDMFIKSPTGTGKTLAYVIPVVQSLQAITPKIQRVNGPYCVILVPTRELALQSFTVLQQVLKPFIWIVPGCVTGGEKRKSEKARLRKGMNILVATPGRLVDHLKTTECLQMSNLQWLILDEADRLLEMGFEEDLSFILSTIKDQAKQKIQTVLLSATLSQGVEKLADITLEKPVTINMTEQDDSSVNADLVEYETPTQLKQYCIVVPMKLRLVTLAAFLKQNYEENCKIIVFFTTQDSVDFHHQLFSTILTTTQGKTMKIMKLHGKLSQQERTKIFLDFRKSNIGVLLCTDVAARGLDLPSVQWIVQYNPAVSVTDYVHRVGRTARIGSSGKALLFLLPTEVAFLNVLKEHKLRLEEMKTDDILNVLLTDQFKLSKMSDVEQFHTAVTYQHTLFEEALSNGSNLRELAKTAFHSFIGAYNTFPATLKSIFHAKNLHLGHLAKSFAFRETPTELKGKISKKRGRRAQLVERKTKQDKKRQMVSELGCDELINGPLTKKAKRTKLQ